VRVVIVEDQVLLRAGLARLFADSGHEIVASLGAADGLTSAVESTRPDLVLLDVRMPPSYTDEGARAARDLKGLHPELGVLLLSQHVETVYSLDLVQLGGFGYLLKDRVLEVSDFLSAAERVAAGGSALDPHVVSTLLSSQARLLRALTEREREVLALMAEGLTNGGIAKRLYVSERTVEAHVRHVLIKLSMPDTEDDHRRVKAVLVHLRLAS
jgi:DNA-binding NarL/FixJ family response regulator